MSGEAPGDATARDDASVPAPARISTRAFTTIALGIAAAVACVVSLFASGHPDGLEYVAQQSGFLASARDSATSASPFADYAAAFIAQPWLSVAVAGAIGCLTAFGLAALVGWGARRRRAAD